MFLSFDQSTTTNAVVQDPGPLETLSGAITWRDYSGLVSSLGLRSACAIPAVDPSWEGIADVLSWLRLMNYLSDCEGGVVWLEIGSFCASAM